MLYINGVQHPPELPIMDYSSPFGATRAYEALFPVTGIYHDEGAHMITLEMFTKRSYILGFDIILDKEADEEYISLPHQGNVHIEARFNKPQPKQISCVKYTEFPVHIKIDNSRNVTGE